MYFPILDDQMLCLSVNRLLVGLQMYEFIPARILKRLEGYGSLLLLSKKQKQKETASEFGINEM